VRAEASCLRAWLYYQLGANFWPQKNIPLKAEEVWSQINLDVGVAIVNAKPFSTVGTKKVWTEAGQAFKSIKDSSVNWLGF
jgi:hypothetical protein